MLTRTPADPSLPSRERYTSGGGGWIAKLVLPYVEENAKGSPDYS
jgi:hypothetical protein